MGILNTLKTSGSLPVNELNVLTSGSPGDLVKELSVLHQGGLVAFEGELPAPDRVEGASTVIRLTKAGLKESLA